MLGSITAGTRACRALSMPPDFKKKRITAALWANSKANPLCIAVELAPRTVGRHLLSWNKMLSRYVKEGQHQKTLRLFRRMQLLGLNPDTFTFVPVLNACASLRVLDVGRRIHAQIIRSACESEVMVGSSLIDMYSKCGSIRDARDVFEKMPSRDVVAWNAMMQGYVKCGEGQKALELFHCMRRDRVEPSRVTYLGILNACASVGALEESQRVEAHTDVILGNCHLDTYAPSVRRDVANVTVQGCAGSGKGQKSLGLSEKVEPNCHTSVGLLNTYAKGSALEEGRLIHKQIVESGFESDVFLGTSLVNMYAKCGSLEDARQVFNKMPIRNVVVWTAMITGYVKCGQGLEALELFQEMEQEQVQPNHVTFLGVLNACASVAALESGRRIHAQILRNDCQSEIVVGNALVNMYAKCGSLVDAWNVFNNLQVRDVVSWTSLLGGYAMTGYAKEALRLFELMCQEGVKMDGITFVCLLSACSHAGLVDEGLQFFESMVSVYGFRVKGNHYACMVDLLGRSGRLHEAEDVIKTMLCENNLSVSMALLGACTVHGNVDIGERIAKRVLELDPGNSSGYVLLSNIYSAAEKWDSRASVQHMKIERAVMKQRGCTWIEVNNQVYTFTADDQRHPQITEIHAELKRVMKQVEEAGYVPDTHFIFYDVDEEENVQQLSYHSEKLAIAFGLISTPPGTPIRITKNLRVCGDCHTSMKFITEVVGREIIVRDAKRFHHFKDGLCSCNDYW